MTRTWRRLLSCCNVSLFPTTVQGLPSASKRRARVYLQLQRTTKAQTGLNLLATMRIRRPTSCPQRDMSVVSLRHETRDKDNIMLCYTENLFFYKLLVISISRERWHRLVDPLLIHDFPILRIACFYFNIKPPGKRRSVLRALGTTPLKRSSKIQSSKRN